MVGNVIAQVLVRVMAVVTSIGMVVVSENQVLLLKVRRQNTNSTREVGITSN